jgi:hypothetical protein
MIERVEKRLKDYFLTHNNGNLRSIYAYLQREVKPKYIVATVKHMISNGKLLTDPYGFQCYIREESGNFFLTRTDERSDPYSTMTTLYYNYNLIGVNHRRFGDVISEVACGEAYEYVKKLQASSNPEKDFKTMVLKMKILEQICLLEIVVKENLMVFYQMTYDYYEKNGETFKNVPNTVPGVVFKHYFRRNLYFWYEPKSAIEMITRLINTGHQNQVATRKVTDLYQISDHTSPVFLHNFYSLIPRKTQAGANKAFIKSDYKIRILKVSEEKWRDTSVYETPAYRFFFSDIAKETEESYRRRFPRYYALNTGGSMFSIKDLEHESLQAAFKGQAASTGKACTSYDKMELLYYTWQLGIPVPKYEDMTSVEHRRKFLMNYNTTIFGSTWSVASGQSNSLPDDFINYCYEAMADKNLINKKFICIRLLEHFIKTDRIYSPTSDPNDLLNSMDV